MCTKTMTNNYNGLGIFKVVFCIYLLADVLQELNILNKIF